MSNRFYVNDVQIFGNNEMFERTYEELKKQGAEWTDDGTFDEIEIKDPQALMDAVETDSLEYLKRVLTENHFDNEKKKFIEREFKDVHDKDILLSNFEDELKSDVWDLETGEQEKYVWRKMCWWIGSKRVFTSYNLYQAIQNDVDFKEGVLKLKEGHTITACMY